MSLESSSSSSLFSATAMTPTAHPGKEKSVASVMEEQSSVLRQILTTLDRQNELLEELVSQASNNQRQRANELGQWRQANPQLSRNCRLAAEALSRVQAEFLNTLTQEATDNADALMDGEFMLTEFVDRFGPRLAHLNGVLQVLAQLSGGPDPETE